MRQFHTIVLAVFLVADACFAQQVYDPIKYAKRLPAFGLFCWHVKGLTLENVQLTTRRPGQRLAIALEDAIDVTINGEKVDKDRLPAGVRFLSATSKNTNP